MTIRFGALQQRSQLQILSAYAQVSPPRNPPTDITITISIMNTQSRLSSFFAGEEVSIASTLLCPELVTRSVGGSDEGPTPDLGVTAGTMKLASKGNETISPVVLHCKRACDDVAPRPFLLA
jgi:hypothetical protein